MAKAWKMAGKEAAAPKQTPNQLVRSCGYGDSFFNFLAAYGLKTDGAKRINETLRVTLRGVEGNGFAQTVMLDISAEGEDATSDDYVLKVLAAHKTIAQHNPAIRRFEPSQHAPGKTPTVA